MNNPFEGKAIKFDTAEQLEHLAELARGYGVVVEGVKFDKSCLYFRKADTLSGFYSNYMTKKMLPEIHYSEFIKGIEAVNVNDTTEMVNHPSHYNVQGFEVIDIIDAFGLNFNMGNALKYLLRADRKGNKAQDLQKALWYLQREIDTK